MTITLYQNYSDNNRVVKNISTVLSVDGELREQCSVQNPTVLINADDIHNANYMYIAEFGRYYYITNVVSVRTNLWAISGHVDVLMSYQSGILACNAIIARNANRQNCNLYLEDDRLIVESKREIQTIEFGGGPATGGKTFVLIVAG